jgi:hypothetical protein
VVDVADTLTAGICFLVLVVNAIRPSSPVLTFWQLGIIKVSNWRLSHVGLAELKIGFRDARLRASLGAQSTTERSAQGSALCQADRAVGHRGMIPHSPDTSRAQGQRSRPTGSRASRSLAMPPAAFVRQRSEERRYPGHRIPGHVGLHRPCGSQQVGCTERAMLLTEPEQHPAASSGVMPPRAAGRFPVRWSSPF